MRVKVRVGAEDTWISDLPESLKHEFSLEELEQMKQQFSDLDTSGDGSIAASELVTWIKSIGIETTLDEVQVLIDKVDDNRSGELEYPEFVRVISEFRRGNGAKLANFIQFSKLARQIRRELTDLMANPPLNTTISGVKENALEWNVFIHGPQSSPYAGGVFHFHFKFGHDYPYEPPGMSCLTQIYHPNFVPLLNGGMILYGLVERWTPDWRMQTLLEEVTKLISSPDVDLMNKFYDETLQLQARTSPTKKRLRHPRDITMECIEMFLTEPERFFSKAQELTKQCAIPMNMLMSESKKLGDEELRKMLSQRQEVEADVRKEDQLRINEFGRNNAALYEIRDQKKALQDKLDTLDDANTELMMGEGDNVQLFIGESFVDSSEEYAQEYIEKLVEETNKQLQKLSADESKLEARQASLKKVLYGRFGQSINLEDK